MNDDDAVTAFLEAACMRANSLKEAEGLRKAHTRAIRGSIHAAAALGAERNVRRLLRKDPASVNLERAPQGWTALACLCFSRYLRLDPKRSGGFLKTATALLDAGADPNSGWLDQQHQPKPAWQRAIYGAAGIARHPELSRLLLERGADPNDDETPYHAPETHDNAVMEVLLASGRLNPDSLATMLLRKADWHDREGIRILLEHGADPDRMTHWHFTPFHQSLRRDNELAIIEALLDHGADPGLGNLNDGMSGFAIAARRGRGDVLALFERKRMPLVLHGVERLIAACAADDAAGIEALLRTEPGMVTRMRGEGGALLAQFAGNGNIPGLAHLLALGVPITAVMTQGDGYFGIATNSTALHVAAWRAQHATVQFLVERGAAVEVSDGQGRTPLALAVRACVDSYWMERRSPRSVDLLLRAGASARGIPYPTGYRDIDLLLKPHQ
jgi:ankyrin repeat protein